MIRIYDLATGVEIGPVTQQQLQTLIDNLEEEGRHDQDYYVNGPTLDMLESKGADPNLIAMLRRALGDRDDMDIKWEDVG